MVVKMLKKILTRKKSPVSKRKYTKKNIKKVKKISKKGGSRGSDTQRYRVANSTSRAAESSTNTDNDHRVSTVPDDRQESSSSAATTQDPVSAKTYTTADISVAQKALAANREMMGNERQVKNSKELFKKRFNEVKANTEVNTKKIETTNAFQRSKELADERERKAKEAERQAKYREGKAKEAEDGLKKAISNKEEELESFRNEKTASLNNATLLAKASGIEAGRKEFDNKKRDELRKDVQKEFDEEQKVKEAGKKEGKEEAEKAQWDKEKKEEDTKEISRLKEDNRKLGEELGAGALATNKYGERIPTTAKLETNLKGDEPLPLMVKVFKKGTIKINDEAEYFNLDNYSLRRLITYWYGSKRSGFGKVLSFFGLSGPPVPVKDWDVSQVTDMSNLFLEVPDFNEDITGWDVSNVQNMSGMFKNTKLFNRNINEWDTGNVRNMKEMFDGAKAFNMYLDQWNTGRVTDMSRMFAETKKFNRVIDTWDVSNVKNMKEMFTQTSYNKPLSSWNVSNVENMSAMFKGAVKFNQPLGQWGSRLTKIKYLDAMFYGAKEFRQDLSDWNLSKIGVPLSMFAGTRIPNDFHPIGQKVNVQEQFTGLSPAEEKQIRNKQERDQVDAELQNLAKARERAQNAYEQMRLRRQREHEEFVEAYKKGVQKIQNELKERVEDKEIEDSEELKKIASLESQLKSLGAKEGSVKKLRTYREIAADDQRTGRPFSAKKPDGSPAGAGDAKPDGTGGNQLQVDPNLAKNWLKSKKVSNVDALGNNYKAIEQKVFEVYKQLKPENKDKSDDQIRQNLKGVDVFKEKGNNNSNPKKPKGRRR